MGLQQERYWTSALERKGHGGVEVAAGAGERSFEGECC